MKLEIKKHSTECSEEVAVLAAAVAVLRSDLDAAGRGGGRDGAHGAVEVLAVLPGGSHAHLVHFHKLSLPNENTDIRSFCKVVKKEVRNDVRTWGCSSEPALDLIELSRAKVSNPNLPCGFRPQSILLRLHEFVCFKLCSADG